MKVGLTSDLHIGITKPKAIRKMFLRLKDENPDVVVIAGDHCGGVEGAKSVNSVMGIAREVMGDTVILAVNGNHDYWCGQKIRKKNVSGMDLHGYVYYRPNYDQFETNIQKCEAAYKKHNIIFLDKHGHYVHPDFPDVLFFGHTLWYNNVNQDSDDELYMPFAKSGNIHVDMNHRMRSEFQEILDKLPDIAPWITGVFISHFPVVELDEVGVQRGGDPRIGDHMMDLGFTKFLNGHTHQNASGPLKYECGGDYTLPRYKMVEV